MCFLKIYTLGATRQIVSSISGKKLVEGERVELVESNWELVILSVSSQPVSRVYFIVAPGAAAMAQQ